jgi:hypothetical protein
MNALKADEKGDFEKFVKYMGDSVHLAADNFDQ